MTTTPTSQPSDYDETDLSAPAPTPDMWATPQAHDAAAGDPARVGRFGTKHGGRNLTDEVHLWPTPRAYSYDESHTPGLTPLDIRVRGLYPGEKRYWPTGRGAPVPSTSSTAALLVSRVRQLVSAVAQPTPAGGGLSSCALLASYNPDGYWQRTQPALFPCDTQEGSRPLDEYSQSWPRWGIVAAGERGRLLMSALRTDASACSSWGDEQRPAPLELAWPTPTVPGGGRSPKGGMSPTGMTPEGIKRQVDLGHHVRNVEHGTDGWPTPRATNRNSRKAMVLNQHRSATSLEQMAELAQGEIPREYQGEEELTPQARRVWEVWATPKSSPSGPDYARVGRPESGGDDLATQMARAEAENWATPRASCHDMDTLERSRYSGSRLREMKQAGQPYQTKTSGMLSARWVCLLMALPPDYLNIPPLPGRAGRRVQAVPKKAMSPLG